MRYRSTTTARRKGLTLVEMMIALALSIFIMAILSEAFITGLNAFGNFKALADLDQRLRTAANIIRRDLKAPHFDGNKRLSECTVSGRPMPMVDGLNGLPATGLFPANQATNLHRQLSQYRFKSPLEGFFSIEEWPNRPVLPDYIKMVAEGQDATLRPSYRDRYDVLHFTSRLEGNEADKFFFGRVRLGSPLDAVGPGLFPGSSRYDPGNNGMYSSQAAELLYFMGNDDTSFLPGVDSPGGPILTFNLYRQSWLLVPDHFGNGISSQQPENSYDGLQTGPPPPGAPNVARNTYSSQNDVSAYQEIINSNSSRFWYNTMANVQHRARRVPSPYAPKRLLNGELDGSDILLTNVISFDVKVYDPFAYKVPMNPLSGRGAYVDIGDVRSDVVDTRTGALVNPLPTAAGDPNDGLQPAFGGVLNAVPYTNPITQQPTLETFDTGTLRFEGQPGGATTFSPAESPATHAYPFPSIQITIRVFEPKSRQTRQITIIQDM